MRQLQQDVADLKKQLAEKPRVVYLGAAASGPHAPTHAGLGGDPLTSVGALELTASLTPKAGTSVKVGSTTFPLAECIAHAVRASVITDEGGNLVISPSVSGGETWLKSWDPVMDAISVARAKLGYFEILYAGDINHGSVSSGVGPILKDRTTATKYRLYVDSGVLFIEAV